MMAYKNRLKIVSRKLLSVMVGIAVIFTAVPTNTIYAEETAVAPKITVSEQAVYAGNGGTFYVRASDFTEIEALKIMVAYDDSVMTVTGAYAGSMTSGASADINYADSGVVKLALASAAGISGSGTLLSVTYKVNANAEPGDYTLVLIVEDACTLDDSGESESIPISKQNGKVSVKAQSQTTPTASFYAGLSKNSLQEGETFDYRLRSASIGNLAGGNFEFTYDKDLLELTGVKLGEQLVAANAIVNTESAGYAKVTFAAGEPLNANYTDLLTLSFIVKADVTTTAEITFKPGGLTEIKATGDQYELGDMNASGFTNKINITKKEVEVTNPELRLAYKELSHGETYQVTATIDGESGLAAGDFTVTYDKDVSVCTDVRICTATGDESSTLGESESMVFTNPEIDEGIVKFHFINASGINADQELIVMTFKMLKAGGTGEISVVGSGTVDGDIKSVTLDYPKLVVDLSHYLKDWEVTKEPGCETVGTKKRLCTGANCQYALQEDIAALGHDFSSEWTVDKEATCSETGLKSRHCTRCDAVTDETELAQLSHTEAVDAAVESTCTEAGKTEGKHCSVCNEILVAQTEVAALGHDLEHHEVKEATCEAIGWAAYDTCKRCDYTTYVEKAALGHNFSNTWSKDENYHWHDCQNSGCQEKSAYAAHAWDAGEVTKEATCTGGGVKTYACEVCRATKTETIAATGHTLERTEAKAPTCTEVGNNEYWTCSECNAVSKADRATATTVTAETIAAKGHTEVIDEAVEPTCTKTGLSEGKHCSVCNVVLVEQKEIAAKGHTEVMDAAIEPTCTKTGLTAGKHCSVCNAVLTAQKEVPAKGHTEVIDEAVAPTCTETGKTAGKHCSVCNEVLIKQEVVPAKGHTEVIDAAVDSTCTETGKTEGKHCSVCNEILKAQEDIPATGHTEAIDAAVAATCEKTGLTEGKHCSVCNEILKAQEEIPAKGHTEAIDEAVAATCEKTGLTEGKHCSVCGAILVKQEVAPTLPYEIVNAVYDTKGNSISNELAIYPKSMTWNEIDSDIRAGANLAIAKLTCDPGKTETVSLGKIPAGDYIAVAGSDYYAYYQSEITIGDSGKTIGFANDLTQVSMMTYNPYTFLYGDVDGSGKIDFADVLWAKRYLAGWQGYKDIDKFALDVDCDGTPDIDDITYIARHLAGWTGYDKLPVTTEPQAI